MKLIPLTQGKSAIVDDEDYEELSRLKWYLMTGGYAGRSIPYVNGPRRQKILPMHRVINQTPDGFQTDHINGNRLDNRRSNLRTATLAENMRNSGVQKNNVLGIKGIRISERSKRNPYRVVIGVNGKVVHIGMFPTISAAIEARAKAAIKYHGEFANV